MLLLRSMLFDFLIYAWMLILGVIGLPAAIVSRDATYWIMKLYCKTVFLLLRLICGLKVESRGEIPQGNVLVASKHQSFLDVMMHFYFLPRAKFIMKKELRWTPIFGFYALRIGSTPVARGKGGTSVKAMVKHIEKENQDPKADTVQLVIYPQGTRVAPGVDAPFKVGAGVIYARQGQACVPAATNTGIFWGRKSWRKKPGTAIIQYLEPIPAGLEMDEFMDKMKQQVETASTALALEAQA